MPVTNTTHGCRGRDDWAPKEPTSRSDKSDKSPSVTFVTSSPGPFTGEIGHSDPQTPQPMVIAGCGVSPDEKSLKATATAAAMGWIWHAANPVEHAPGQCAACGTAFQPPVMTLPDGAQVCDRPGHACLIAYGNGRRMAATTALKERGIKPPMWWEL